jgi:hypothetical protein
VSYLANAVKTLYYAYGNVTVNAENQAINQ